MSDLGDWTRFGRIDADGTVYVKTSSGERAVGSWQAGTTDEGLAHFARKYADLVVEVDLIASRLNSDSADVEQAAQQLRKLREGLDSAAVVGDVDALATRLDELSKHADERVEEFKAVKEAERADAIAAKEALVAEAEEISQRDSHWKASGQRFREMVEEWKSIHGVDRKTDQKLWRKFAAARDAFTRRRGAYFSQLDAERKVIAAKKEELIAAAEELSTSTDWGPTADRLKALMAEWKEAGRLAPDAEQKAWKRFRAAQDVFFNARSEAFSARDAELEAHQAAKEELLREAEALDISADPKAAQAAFRRIQGSWHEIGPVPRKHQAKLQRRLRNVEDKLREAMDTAWRKVPVEENPLLLQMKQQVAEAEEKLERAKAEGDPKRVKKAEEDLAGKKQFLELAEGAK
ncbi:DUF349 domain-containing protein [Glycomyces xiaoerkulensis]|uniref:DUF349 domain-containing protein n=1 Tax=Glycomyces xiaoerkulensis TaxID=2038139 RepID=UPI000C263B33|nr:DUF349 domain-containing protein [Glycomyces xiaoerkulensis]